MALRRPRRRPSAGRRPTARKYYFDANGNMTTGFTTISGNRYFFNNSGVMLTGLQEIAGIKYYFYPEGNMAVSTTIVVGTKQYTVNENGIVTAEENLKINGATTGAQIRKLRTEVCRQSICIWWNKPHERRGLFRICTDRIFDIRHSAAACSQRPDDRAVRLLHPELWIQACDRSRYFQHSAGRPSVLRLRQLCEPCSDLYGQWPDRTREQLTAVSKGWNQDFQLQLSDTDQGSSVLVIKENKQKIRQAEASGKGLPPVFFKKYIP